MKTLIISSSVSKESRSFILCNDVCKRLSKKGVQVELIDARKIELLPYHLGPSESMDMISKKIDKCDNIIIGMGVHCYSINDALKIILDNCFMKAEGKFYGIICAAGGEKSYLSTQHLTQICMNEWRMMQLPQIVYATSKDFNDNMISSKDVLERLELFTDEFYNIGNKLIH